MSIILPIFCLTLVFLLLRSAVARWGKRRYNLAMQEFLKLIRAIFDEQLAKIEAEATRLRYELAKLEALKADLEALKAKYVGADASGIEFKVEKIGE